MLDEFNSYLKNSKIPIRISCLTGSGWPLNLSLWFIYENGLLYMATPKKAKVVKYLENDSRCSFEIAPDEIPYCGIRGQARASIDESRGNEILEKLLMKYLGGLSTKLAKSLLSRTAHEVAIVIKPLTLFTWNFQDRMSDAVDVYRDHPCP